MSDDTPFCLVPDCEGSAVADAPLDLCQAHFTSAFAYVMRRAEHRSADVVPTPIRPPKKRSRLTQAGWVYFIRKGDLIKIGWSANPAHRFRALQPDRVLHLERGTMADEQRCHKAFDHLRAHGEWFHPAEDLIDFIDSLRTAA